MLARDLSIGDVLFVLRHGFVFEEPQASTQEELFKYLPESRSPNSGNRLGCGSSLFRIRRSAG